MTNPLVNYNLKETLGEGGFAEVILAIHRSTGTAVAIKIVPSTDPNDPTHRESIEREIEMLYTIEHPNVYKLFDFIRTEDKYYMVFEYLDNGRLLDFVNNNGRLLERTARQFFTQLISAMIYLNARGIAHRDIKAENVLLDRNFNLRLIDFGLSNYFNKDFPIMRTICGCVAYAPPEMLKEQPYFPSADVWSAGVLLYAVCAGYLPFSDPNIPRLIEKVINEDPVYPNFFSDELRDLLTKMLCKDPLKRISLSEITQHPWFNKDKIPFVFDDIIKQDSLDQKIVEFLKENYHFNTEKIMIKPTKAHFLDRPNNETVAYNILRRLALTDDLAAKYSSPEAHLPINFSVIALNTPKQQTNKARKVLYRQRSKTPVHSRNQRKSVYVTGPLKLGYG